MLPAKSFHKIRILRCLFPDTMIDMRHGKRKRAPAPVRKEHPKKTDRICPSGNSRNYPVPFLNQLPFFYKRKYLPFYFLL